MSELMRFHLSLNVKNLQQSIRFYKIFFGLDADKVRSDYAKFELSKPPLVLSLEPANEITSTGSLNHVGFRIPDVKTLVSMQERLERSGLRTQREEGVECCYAKQTKFWAHDPDGTLWEFYTFDGDLDHRGGGQTEEVILGKAVWSSEPVIWTHRMGEQVPGSIPLSDGKADEVHLRGTLNLPLSPEEQKTLVAESIRVLKSGGRIFVHVLVGETNVNNPDLPGPAGAVRSVPFENEPLTLLQEAGLVGIRMLKYESRPCFVRNGVEMRELQLEAFTPELNGTNQVEVMYKGPFQEVRHETGLIFTRGKRVLVPEHLAKKLKTPEMNNQFVSFEANTSQSMASCTS